MLDFQQKSPILCTYTHIEGDFGDKYKRDFAKLKPALIWEPKLTVLFNDVAICA